MGSERAIAELAKKFVAEHAEPGTAIEDINLISDAHLDAGGIASVAQVLGLWSGRGAAHAPKLNLHKPRLVRVALVECDHLPVDLSAVVLGEK